MLHCQENDEKLQYQLYHYKQARQVRSGLVKFYTYGVGLSLGEKNICTKLESNPQSQQDLQLLFQTELSRQVFPLGTQHDINL